MWEISSEVGGNSLKIGLCNVEYSVGRKDCDLVISNDPSISRKHAVLQCTHTEQNVLHPELLPILVLKEESKLGTVVDDVRKKGEEVVLEPGVQLSFGTTGNNKFRVHFKPLVVTTSCVAGAVKKTVRTQLAKLGGHLVSEWVDGCDLLVMSSLSVTVKVIAALTQQKHIVTPSFLEHLVKSFQEKTARPSEEEYLPPVSESQIESQLVSFSPNPMRRNVFQGKLFLFLSAGQLKKLQHVIELAGGTPMMLECGQQGLSDLSQPDTLVMQPDLTEASQATHEQRTWHAQVYQQLKKLHKRFITDSEIGFAVLYCSTEQHCNPCHNLGSTSSQTIQSQDMSSLPAPHQQDTSTLVPDTENFTQTKNNRPLGFRPGDMTHIDETVATLTSVKVEPLTPAGNGVKRSSEQEASSVKRQCIRSRSAVQVPDGERDLFDDDSEDDTKPSVPEPMEDVLDDFLSVSSRRSRAKQPIGSSEKVTRKTTPSETTDKVAVKTEIAASDFSDIPSRKARKLTQVSTTQSSKTQDKFHKQPAEMFDEVTDFGAVLSRRKPSQHPQPIVVEPVDDNKDSSRETNQTTVAVKEELPATHRNTETCAASEWQEDTAMSELNHASESNFMSSAKVCNEGGDMSVKEEGLPVGCIIIQHASLICRQYGGKTNQRPQSNGTMVWKGRQVKNFKKFRKNLPGSDNLPTIIGGSDLAVHIKKSTPGLDDWFEQQLTLASQQHESSQAADEIFDNWGPSLKRRR